MKQLDLTSTYDYYARLRDWQQRVEPNRFVVRRFERESFIQNSLYDDYLASVGLDVRAEDLDPIRPVNESLDAESVEFLRILNIYRVDHEGAKPGFINNRKLVARLARSSDGPTLALPDRALDLFMEKWDASNRAVARDFLGDKTEQLFHAPRKQRGITTKQYLDPERLEHFNSLLELPEQVHAPLRVLAEREARGL
jgi:hypothetical protein